MYLVFCQDFLDTVLCDSSRDKLVNGALVSLWNIHRVKIDELVLFKLCQPRCSFFRVGLSCALGGCRFKAILGIGID